MISVCGLERAEAMTEALRDPDLVPAGRGQLDHGVASEIRRTGAQVDGDIKDRTAHHPHQLGLRVRRQLEMDAADRIPACSV